MNNINIYQEALQNSVQSIENRHFYVASIVKYLFNPDLYKTICEIGGSNFELADILSNYYHSVVEYEPNPMSTLNKPNLTLYKRQFDGSSYNLTSDAYVSVCPYINSYYSEENEISYYDKQSCEQLKEIIKTLMNKDKELLFVLFNTPGMETCAQEIITEYKNQILLSDINLHVNHYGTTKVSHHKVLLYKK